MRTTTADCQVLVVGAGPTGLVLAAELLSRGINTRIMDKGDGIALQSRANGLHSGTLEVLDTLGLADAFIRHGHIVSGFRWYSDGRVLGKLDLALNGSRFGFLLDIPQNMTESLLRGRVRELGGKIEHGLEVIGLRQDAGAVNAKVRDTLGAEHQITADYVVGCDGAHSRVRHELGVAFDGHIYQEDWLLADVRMDWCRSEDEVHAFFRADGGPMICFPMRDHIWRIVLPYSGDRARQVPTLAEIQQLVDQRAPERIVLSDAQWLANFRCQRRSTNVYRRGRILLAGDAVHVHSPAGGQGMNTGIMDAHNLAWKLALVAAGDSADSLLDTYAEERAPVATDVLALTHALVRIGTVRHPVGRMLRDRVVPLACRSASVQRWAARGLGHQSVGYHDSSLTRRAGYGPGLRPGDKAPDATLIGSAGEVLRLHELLRRGQHVLVVSSADARWIVDRHEEMRRFRSWLEVAVGALDTRGGAYLVRPDGYLAARASTTRPNAIVEYLHHVFATPTRKLLEVDAAHLPPIRRAG